MPTSFTDNIVSVSLALGTQPLSVEGFNLPLVITTNNVFGTRTQRFTSLASMISAGFASDSAAYKQAALMFAGVNAPESVLVGRRAMTNATVSFTAVNSTTYTVTLRSGTVIKTFSFTSDATATAPEIATGLQTLIAADGTWNAIVTATVATNNLVLTPIVGKYFDVSVGANSSVVFNSTEDLDDTLAAIVAENSSWFWLTSDSHTLADVSDLAAYAEANDKMYVWSSQDVNVRDKVASNILETISALGYDLTVFAMWSPNADSTFPEAGVVGALAGQNLDSVGTTTLHGKTLKGVAANSLTTTQKDNIISQGGNVYTSERGAGFYRDGQCVSGNFVDTIVFSRWLKARIEESVSGLLKRQSDLGGGVRFTTEGITQVKQAINKVIQRGINADMISNETPKSSSGDIIDLRPVISVPSLADISEDDLANRTLNNVIVEVIYTGFVHYVKVNVDILLTRS